MGSIFSAEDESVEDDPEDLNETNVDTTNRNYMSEIVETVSAQINPERDSPPGLLHSEEENINMAELIEERGEPINMDEEIPSNGTPLDSEDGMEDDCFDVLEPFYTETARETRELFMRLLGAPTIECAESRNISTLIEKAQACLDAGGIEDSKRLALQAMVGAQDAMDACLKDDRQVQAQQLADWFGQCAFILNEVDAVLPALRCFYTATIFDREWKEQNHINTSAVLWKKLFSQDRNLLHLQRENIYYLMDKLLVLAELAVERWSYQLGAMITGDLVMTLRQLVFVKQIYRYNTVMSSVNKQYFDALKSISICQARCFMYMGVYDVVKKICGLVLDKMCDYDDPDALEIWGMTLYYENNHDIAEKKIQLALKYVKKGGEDERRLIELLVEIADEKLYMKEDEEVECSGGVDPSWLVGTAADQSNKAQHPNTSSAEKAKQKKTKTKTKTYKRYPVKQPSPTSKKETGGKRSASKRRATMRNKTTEKLMMEDGRDRSRGLSECSVETTSTVASERASLYSGQWTDSESDEEVTLSDYCLPNSSLNSPESGEGEEIEEASFYEQSYRFHMDGDATDSAYQMKDDVLMKSGLELNMEYMAPFEDKPAATNRREPFYEPFRSREVLRECLLKQPNVFIRCKVQIEGSHLSYCTPVESVSNIDCIEISGRQKAGQIYNEDEVVVQLLDLEHEQEDKRYGKIVGVWERKRCKDVKHPVFICTLDDMGSHLVRPMCKTLPKIHILNDAIMKKCPRLKKYRVEVYTYDHSCGTLEDPKIYSINPSELNRYVFLVAFIKWRRHMIYPTGAVIRILPYGETLKQGLMLLNLKHEVPSLYQRSVVDRMESMIRRGFDEPDVGYQEDRLDLRTMTTFTIDPPGCRDIDDALSVERLDNGFKVGVHIADVSQYVQEGDPIDQEARRRATTFYPGIEGKSPRNMLPEPLSNNMCSLLPNKTRLTLSVFFYLTKSGKLKQMDGPSIEIKKTVIRSCQQFTYGEVQDIIDGRSEHQLQENIKCLFQLATEIRKERLQNSMYAMHIRVSDEIDPEEDAENDTVQAHYLVEEFMIMANRAVARKLVRTYPESVPLRCQPAPGKEKMMDFVKKHSPYIDVLTKLQDKKICDYMTPKLDNVLGTSVQQQNASVMVPKHIWELIMSATPFEASKIIRTDDLYPLQHLVLQGWLEIQERAEYRCSSGLARSQGLHHYSLEMFPYTHFTSPIRRYIDLVVHRLLHAALTRTTSSYNKEDIENICAHVNSVTRHAKNYQKECKILKQAVDLKRNPKIVTCYVNEVTDRSLTLASPDLKHVTGMHRELPLNLLDVGFKPDQGQDPTTGLEFVTTTWRKRVYDSKGATSLVPTSINPDDRKILNPNAGIYFVQLQHWARMLKCSFEGRNGDLSKKIRSTNYMVSERGFDDVSTEHLDVTKMQPNTIFSMTYKHGQSVKVQLAAVPWKGMLVPKPTVYDMTNNVKFCLQHVDDPVLHLSYYATRATCDQYKDTKIYLERWLPLMEMEAAINAVTNEESCIINDVPIKFGKDLEGRIVFPLGFCEERNIEFSGTFSEDDSDDVVDSSTKAYDWLCIKCVSLVMQSNQRSSSIKSSTQQAIWVAHAKITSVVKKKPTKERSEDKMVVQFRLHSNSLPLPDEARGKDSKFSIEILRKSEVDRRTETYMRQMPVEEDSLARTIALNKGAIPDLNKSRIEMTKSIERDLIIPPSDDQRPLPKNNKMQQEAIDKALKHRFTLIQGPPGTGKTYTGIKLLYLFDKINGMLAREGGQRRQVLMCGPSNKSVDLVARLMIRRLGSLCPKFVRVYGRSLEAVDYPIPGRTFQSKRSTRDHKPDEDLVSVTLHQLIRKKGKPYAEKINAMDKMFKDSGYAPQPREITGEYVHMVREASIDEIRKHDVILCTTAVGSNPKILKAAKVFQVIVDEAGMCPEPQCLVPIIATKAEQVVLIGDHKQLRPIIKSKEAAELGLERSLFERYADADPASKVQFTMLDIQYRMNPQLCRYPSQRFYNGLLKTEAGLWMHNTMDIWPKSQGQAYPHVLIPVVGEEKVLAVSTEDGNEHSKSNMEEADHVIKLFRYFVEEGIPTNEINVISQYNAQCAEIKNRLKADGFRNFNVTTVVSSQGGEWDYVIFSTVRSLPDYKIESNPTLGWCKQNLGFITDENQINVALTRARKGLVIVGNQNLLRCDRTFGRLIQHYQDKGCVLDADAFPPPHRSRQERLKAAVKRTYERYGDDMFTRGEATFYEGSYDVDIESSDEDESGFRRVRRRGQGRGRGRGQGRGKSSRYGK